jgi:HAD superfamily hydrolase (TIGR01509 family)
VAREKIRALIFDIGRVLIGIDVKRAMGGLASGLALSPEELWHAIEKDPAWRDWQEGRISARDWHLRINQRFGSSLSFQEFTDTWNLVLHPEPLQDIELLRRLSKRYHLALLSNTDPVHVAYMESHYEFFPLFPTRIYSCNVGAAKPSPLIYREALRGCRARAQEAVYIDDIPAFVEAAKILGMQGVSYQSPEQLKASLAELNIEP